MRIRSPVRRNSWTKHTSYPTANMDGKVPGELASLAQASKKSTNQELEAQQSVLNTMKRKSISFMDKQRKELEKSMIAYTTKMKEISNSRATNDLFRDIHTRNAICEERETLSDRPPSIKHDLESLSSDSYSSGLIISSTRSLPARPERGVYARRHSELRTLKGFKQIDVRSPIMESRENSTPELRRLMLTRSSTSRHTNSSSLRRTSDLFRMFNSEQKVNSDSVPFRPAMTKAKFGRKRIPDIRTADDDQVANDTDKNQLYPNIDSQSIGADSKNSDARVTYHLEPVSTRLKYDVFGSPPDSAYSSATEDSNDSGILAESENSSEHESEQTSVDVQVTVPKLRLRRRKSKRQSRYFGENLVKQSVLKRAKNLMMESKRKTDHHRSIL